MTDEEKRVDRYITAIASGDRSALEQLYRIMKVEMAAIAFSILGDLDLAADAVQETALRVLERSSLYTPGTNGVAWIRSICRNLSIDMVRRRIRTVYADPDVVADRAGRSGDRDRTSSIAVHSALASMERRDREIVVMRGIEGRRFREIADELRLNENTVRSRYSRALAKLRALLREGTPGPVDGRSEEAG